MDGPDWKICQVETKINPPLSAKDLITELADNVLERKLAMRFSLLTYKDGSFSPESLDMMKYVRTIVCGK